MCVINRWHYYCKNLCDRFVEVLDGPKMPCSDDRRGKECMLTEYKYQFVIGSDRCSTCKREYAAKVEKLKEQLEKSKYKLTVYDSDSSGSESDDDACSAILEKSCTITKGKKNDIWHRNADGKEVTTNKSEIRRIHKDYTDLVNRKKVELLNESTEYRTRKLDLEKTIATDEDKIKRYKKEGGSEYDSVISLMKRNVSDRKNDVSKLKKDYKQNTKTIKSSITDMEYRIKVIDQCLDSGKPLGAYNS